MPIVPAEGVKNAPVCLETNLAQSDTAQPSGFPCFPSNTMPYLLSIAPPLRPPTTSNTIYLNMFTISLKCQTMKSPLALHPTDLQ